MVGSLSRYCLQIRAEVSVKKIVKIAMVKNSMCFPSIFFFKTNRQSSIRYKPNKVNIKNDRRVMMILNEVDIKRQNSEHQCRLQGCHLPLVRQEKTDLLGGTLFDSRDIQD